MTCTYLTYGHGTVALVVGKLALLYEGGYIVEVRVGPLDGQSEHIHHDLADAHHVVGRATFLHTDVLGTQHIHACY